MKRIDTATKAVDLFGPGKHGFKAGNVLAGEAPTKLSSAWFNHMQEELANLVEQLFGVSLNEEAVDQLATLFAAKFATLAPLADAELTGGPTAPTQPPGTNSQLLANTAFVQAAIAALVDSSPATLDTLQELANALGNDPNFATTITTLIGTKLALSGGELTDFLTLHAEPTATRHAATKKYVDDLISAISAATTDVAGLIEILTNAEFNTGTDSSRAVVASNFVRSLGVNGRMHLPAGLILQWGRTGNISNTGTLTVTLPIAFTTEGYVVIAMHRQAGASSASRSAWGEFSSLSQIELGQNNSAGTALPLFWFALGK